MQQQEPLFVFVTGEGRVMARLANGVVADVTEYCDLLPRTVCKKQNPVSHDHIKKAAA